MDAAERRRRREKKIKSRINLLKNKYPYESRMPKFIGMLTNNNEVNALMGGGRKRKTKTKNTCATYRHHGGYGAAKQYTAHDKRQVVLMEEQINEFYTENTS